MHVDHRAVRARRIILATGLALAAGLTAYAHKAVTSPYTYNEHVYPIIRAKCGQCHVEGGAAPMSLMVYNDPDRGGGAFAWAQAMREMLVAEAMPPWYADETGPEVTHQRRLTSRELDIIVTWAAGGSPEGDPARKPSAEPAPVRWALGQPDLVLRMAAAHEVAAETPEETVELTLPTNLANARWVRAADLLPGTPTMVRRAVISVEGGPVLAQWEPGDEAAAAPAGTAFQLPARAKVHLQIFYKKSWQEELQKKADRSSVGLYFTNPPASGKGIDAFTVTGPKTSGAAPVSVSAATLVSGRVLAVRPQLDRPYASMEITAVTTSGKREPLLKLHAARPEWPRRYWLAAPVELPAGTKIEVTGTPADSDRGPLVKGMDLPLQVALDFVPQQ